MIRDTGKYISLVVLESVFGAVVAATNMLLITIMVFGGRRLMTVCSFKQAQRYLSLYK